MKKYLFGLMLSTSILALTACGTTNEEETTTEESSEEVAEESTSAPFGELFALMTADDYELSSELIDGCPAVTKVAYFSPDNVYDVPETAFEATTKVAYHDVFEEVNRESMFVYLADYTIPSDSTNPWEVEAGEGDHMVFLEFHTDTEGTDVAEGTYDSADETSPSRSGYQLNHDGSYKSILSAAQISSEITFMDNESVCGTFAGEDEFGGVIKGVFSATRQQQ